MPEVILCTKIEAMNLLSCNEERFQDYIDNGIISILKQGDTELFNKTEIESYLNKAISIDDSQDGLHSESAVEQNVRDTNDSSSDSDDLLGFDLTPNRDRIVILGQRNSGKTVFITRLYEQLWESKSAFHIKALAGESHLQFMEFSDMLSKGKWLGSTNEHRYSDLELTDGEFTRLLVMLDYPGEDFKKAFVENIVNDRTEQLIEHVNKALAVIVLLSPDINDKSSIAEQQSDKYGMTRAIEYIRSSPGGDAIPIAIVVTKGDQYKDIIREKGGLKSFISTNYPQVLRVIGEGKPFIISAVQCIEHTANGEPIPSYKLPPINLLHPLKWCWKKISASEITEAQNAHRELILEQQRSMLEEHNQKTKKAVLFWSIFWSIALVLGGLVALITLLAMQPE